MAPFRGSDERLDREIETLEAIARLRVRRVAQELRDIDKDLSELHRERARRRATAEPSLSEPVGTPVEP
jgi:uncharacterized membrane protein YccC